jgi:RNA polymerase sigma factor (sigma-70 family)
LRAQPFVVPALMGASCYFFKLIKDFTVNKYLYTLSRKNLPIDNEHFKQLLISWPKKAIALLYENYYISLRNAAEWRTHDQRLAEDVVQETFAYLWKNHKQIAAIETLFIEPYLFTMIKNRAITASLQNKRSSENLQQYINDTVLENVSEPDEEMEPDDNRIWQEIDTFPRSERECLTLKYKQRMSNEEIARHLSVTVKAVERSITSAYKRLRQIKPGSK